MNIPPQPNLDALRKKLQTLVSEHKAEFMQRVLAERSRYIAFVFERFYHDHNIHAALRSVESCGFQDVHIIANDKKFDSNLTITKGAEYWLSDYVYAQEGVDNTQVCLDTLKSQGYMLVGTTPHAGAYTPETLPLDKKIALIMGNERIGISDYTRSRVDYCITIPMCGFTESYNASVSAAIIAYELRKRLKESDLDWHLSEQEKVEIELEWLMRLVRGSEFIAKDY